MSTSAGDGARGSDRSGPQAGSATRAALNAGDLKSLPVVMLTSSREEADLQAAYDLDANAYVVKPVDFNEFVDAVRQVGVFWALLNEPVPVGRLQ